MAHAERNHRSTASVLAMGAAVGLALSAAPAAAQDQGVTYGFYGTPGLLEMPASVTPPSGDIAASVGYFSGTRRTTLTFQVSQSLSGSFRYSSTEDYTLPGQQPFEGSYFDRSFDVAYRLWGQDGWRPSVTVGLRDFLGTGQYSGEYIVATRTLGDSFRVSAGLGWGRLGSYNGFDNPLGVLDDRFEDRPALDFGVGGEVEYDQFFRGDAAAFGGVEYYYSDTLVVKAEYSSDAYVQETALGLIDRSSPFNFGVTYTPSPAIEVTGAFLHGSEFGLVGTINFNPGDRPSTGGFDSPPVPVLVRQGPDRVATTWDRITLPEETIRDQLRRALGREGIEIQALEITDRTARIRYQNNRYRADAQAQGRVARIMTDILPASVEVFVLEPTSRGLPMSATTLRRTDLETYELVAGGTAAIEQARVLSDAGGNAGLVTFPEEDPFSWYLAPYGRFVVFNAQRDFNIAAGVEVGAAYEISPNLILSGSVRQQLISTTGEQELIPDDEVPGVHPVRRNIGFYLQEGPTAIQDLTLAYNFRPAANTYGRVTVGLLELMYAGISTEVLYAPVDTRWAAGLEVNYVTQRDFDGGFGLRDYDNVNGHASLYYDFGSDFEAQVDVGRYLAGDWGTTLSLNRTFDNGWRVGAYASFTDIAFEDFGEGSFDKGISIEVPLDWVLGQPTQRTISNTLASLTRDGGARLNVEGRLYETVRDGHLEDLSDGWGRFWR